MSPLVHPKERLYFGIGVAVSAVIYAVLIVSIVGIAYILMGALFGAIVGGMLTGRFRGNAIRVSPRQFADVHEQVQRISREMGMTRVPEVYVEESGGILNAFATRFFGRDFVVLYSEVVELARESGGDALAFIIAHELAHHHRGHVSWKRWLVLPASMIPFLGGAYSRACEYTCDAYGARHSGRGAIGGLLALAAGKELYRDVDPVAYAQQVVEERGFWVWAAEVLSTHPNTPKRVAAVMQAGASASLGPSFHTAPPAPV